MAMQVVLVCVPVRLAWPCTFLFVCVSVRLGCMAMHVCVCVPFRLAWLCIFIRRSTVGNLHFFFHTQRNKIA